MEAKRVLGNRLFLAVLVGLLVLSSFFYLYQRPDTWDAPLVDGELYHRQLEQLKDKSWEEALAWCERYQIDARAAMERYEWDYDSEAEELRIVAAQLQTQYEYLLGYDVYLEEIQKNAQFLQTVSLFADPTSSAYWNTVKTAQDFEKMLGVPVSAGHDLAVTEFFTDQWTDYSVVILICVVCGLFLAERKEGLWPVIHATDRGRWKMALRRCGILFAAAWIGTVVLVGARILLCGMEYHGLGEWDRILQSIPMFSNVPTPMTVGQFWLLYIAVKAVGAFWIGSVLWSILSAIANLGLAFTASGLVLGVEFACTAIPTSSMFAPLRYVNVFSFIDFGTVFTRYLNLELCGFLISGSDLVLVMLPFLCLIFGGVDILLAEKKYPIAPQNPLLRWMDGVTKRLDPIFARSGEAYKLLIKRKGILLLLLLVFLACNMEAPPRTYVSWNPFIQFYQEQYAGPITQEKLEQMELALQNCPDADNREGLSAVLEAAKKAPEGAWIVPSAPYDAIWSDNEENYHRSTALLAMLILVLVLAPIASQERQNDMSILLRSTFGGRKRLMVKKQSLLVAVAAVVWALVYGMELIRTIEAYGRFACLNAPAFSFPLFRWLGAPLWATIALYYAAKLLVLVGVGELCFFLSSRCGKNRDAMLLCVGVLLIPATLGAIGSAIGECTSFLLPLSAVELLWGS